MTEPDRIWTDWKQANAHCVAFDEPPKGNEGYQTEYVLASKIPAMIAAEVEKAVKAERERCAKIAAQCEAGVTANFRGRAIASAIRGETA